MRLKKSLILVAAILSTSLGTVLATKEPTPQKTTAKPETKPVQQQTQTQEATRQKAKTLDELIARYDSTSCRDCHENIYKEWEESLHAKSIYGTGRTAATLITAIDKGLKMFPHSGVKDDKDIKVEHLMICAKCHLPQLKDATDDVAKELVSLLRTWQKEENEQKKEQLTQKLASLNIGCTVCHNDLAIVHKWADGYPQPDTIYGKKTGAHDHPVFTKMAKAPAMGESIFCGQCHGLGPNFELPNPSQCATLYGSHLYAYVPEGGYESCQDCHMRKSKLGHNMQAYRSETMRKMAVDVKVHSRALYWRKNKEEGVIPMGYLDVELYNKAGHVIPDG